MKKQAQGWLNSAADDLLVVEEIIGNPLLTHMVAFHSEQAIEKCFKAVLEENEASVPQVHDQLLLHNRIRNTFQLI
jgi:HEPN domain-containing protein